MKIEYVVVLIVAISVTFAIAFILNLEDYVKSEKREVWLPNPSAIYCKSLGYKYKVINTEKGQVGYCVFPDNTSCSAWKFFRGECKQEYTACKRFYNGSLVYENGTLFCIFDGRKCKEFLLSQGKC